RAVVLQVRVLGAVPAAARAHVVWVSPAGEVGARVDDQRRRRRALLQRGEVVDHLEGRPRLSLPDPRDVELPLHARILAVVVVDGPDVREDLAVARAEW